MVEHICKLLNGKQNKNYISLEKDKIAIFFNKNKEKDSIKKDWKIASIYCMDEETLKDKTLIGMIEAFKCSEHNECYIDVDNNLLKLL